MREVAVRAFRLVVASRVHLRSHVCAVRRAALSRRRPKTINQLEILQKGREAQKQEGTDRCLHVRGSS